MRKILVVLAGATVLLGLLSPAEAATRKTYVVTFNPAPAGKTDPVQSYNDTSLDVSENIADGRQKTRIRGKLTLGGKPVKAKKLYIYATNKSTTAKTRKSLGSVTTSSSGYFTKTFDPGHDNAGVYKIEVIKYADSKGKERRTGFDIRVFQFVEALNEYVPADGDGVEYVQDAPTAYGQVYDQSYLIDGGSTVEFDFTGYTCLQFNFKMTRAQPASVDGQFSVMNGSKELVGLTQLNAGDAGQYTAPSEVQKLFTAGGKLRFTVAPYVDDLNPVEEPDDQTKVTMVLGRPMVSCTYPINNP